MKINSSLYFYYPERQWLSKNICKCKPGRLPIQDNSINKIIIIFEFTRVMKKNDNSEIDKILIDSPAYLLNLVKESLDTKNVKKKLSSRMTLVKMGKKILPQMYKLLKSEEVLYRMEAVKIIELIGDRTSIPVLVELLDDNEFDIRWIASEALIKIGRSSIRPVLKSVRDGENSILLNESAHHVLTSLLSESEKKNEMELLLSLENHHSLGTTAPVAASIALGPVINNNKSQ
jgi:hypothetical protein